MTARNVLILTAAVCGAAFACGAPAALGAEAPPVPGPASFTGDVLPILREKCQGCHQPSDARGKLVLTGFHELMTTGRGKAPIIIPGKPQESLLVQMLSPRDGKPPRMPKDDEPLVSAQLERISQWIAEGAIDDTPPPPDPAAPGGLPPPVYPRPPVVTSLDFSPDGSLLAVPGRSEVLLHRGDGSGIEARLVGSSDRIESVAFSPDGKLLAAAGGTPGSRGEVQVWDVEKRSLRLAVPVSADCVRGAGWSHDGALISFGCSDNTVRAIDALTGKQVLYQGAHADWVLDTAFSTDSSHLVTVTRDGTMKLIQVKTQGFVDDITSITPGAMKGGFISVRRRPGKDELLAGGSDGEPKLYKMYRTQARVIGDDFNLLKRFEPVPGRVFAVRWYPDGGRIVVGSSFDGSGEVRSYGAEDGKALWSLPVPTAVFALAVGPGGKTIAAGGFDGRVRWIDGESGKVIRDLVPVPIDLAAVPAAPAPAPAPAQDPKPAPADPANPAKGPGGEAVPRESLPPGAKLLSIEAFPASIELTGPYSSRQVLLTGILEGGGRVDVTRLAKAEAAPELVEATAGRVRPLKDGSGEIRFSLEDRSAAVPVSVAGLDAPPPPSFTGDVMPLLSRIGCNAGTCHGAAKGKNGFKLSLRGYDPVSDWRALTDDLSARRFDRAAPETSLFLRKPSGAVPHGGGTLVRPSEPAYEILRAWIANGARIDLATPRVERIELLPADPVIQLFGMAQGFAVLATYADGRVRDVTGEAFVEAGNIEVARADRGGIVTALRRGESAVMARYEGKYAATNLIVMGDRSGFAWKEVEEHNAIDTLVYKKLRRVGTLPADLCTDAEFLRRVSLDLTGLPPTTGETRSFLLDTRPSRTKREETIDRLIGSAQFLEHWTYKWSDLLQVNRKFLGEPGAAALREWIRGAVASDMPYDRFAAALLDSSGSTLKNPPAGYYKILRRPEEVMENTTQLFLGVRFSCAKCHDHPFERWTQRNYWELSDFFAQVERKNAPGSPIMPAKGDNQPEDAPPAFEELVSDGSKGDVQPPSGGKILASFPFPVRGAEAQGEAAEARPRRAQVTSWLTSPENPYFARSLANRIWSYFLGRGLIEPVDDIRAGNPPSNPELLDHLTRELIASGFRIRPLMRRICASRVYQHSYRTNRWNEDDELNFSHALARRLAAESLYDAIHMITGTAVSAPGIRPGTRSEGFLDPAVKTADGFLDLFGRPPRESSCECERSASVSLGQALHLVNGPTLADAIRSPAGAIAGLVAVETDPERILEELFISILARPPDDGERARLAPQLDPAGPSTFEALGPEDTRELATRAAAWEKAQSVATWTVLEPAIARSAGAATLTRQPDGSLLASGPAPEKDVYTLVAWTDLTGITGVRLEVLPDPSLKASGPGRSDSGNLVLSEIRLAAAPASDPGAAKRATLESPSADFSQPDFPPAAALDGKPETGWAIGPEPGRAHQAVFETKEDLGAPGGTILTFTLEQGFGVKHTIGRLRLSVTTERKPVRAGGLPEEISRNLQVAAEKRTPEQAAAVLRAYLPTDPEMAVRIRLAAVQDLAWALMNSPAFLFNH